MRSDATHATLDLSEQPGTYRPKTLCAYNAYFIDANLLVTLTVLLFCRFFGGYVSVLCCRPPSLVSTLPLGGPAGAATFGGLQPAGAIGIQAAPSPASYLSPLPQIRPRPRQRQGGQVRTRGGESKGRGLRRVIQSSICSTCSAGGAFRFVFLRHILRSFLLIVSRSMCGCPLVLYVSAWGYLPLSGYCKGGRGLRTSPLRDSFCLVEASAWASAPSPRFRISPTVFVVFRPTCDCCAPLAG